MSHAILIDAGGLTEIEIPGCEQFDELTTLADGRTFYRERETVVFRHVPVPASIQEWR